MASLHNCYLVLEPPAGAATFLDELRMLKTLDAEDSHNNHPWQVARASCVGLHDWTLDSKYRNIYRDAQGSRSKAIGRCSDDPAFPAQSTIQSRCVAGDTASSWHRLYAHGGIGWVAPRPERLTQHGMAQRFVPRLRRLHANAGIRSWSKDTHSNRKTRASRNHVCRSGTVAMSSFINWRRTEGARHRG